MKVLKSQFPKKKVTKQRGTSSKETKSNENLCRNKCFLETGQQKE